MGLILTPTDPSGELEREAIELATRINRMLSERARSAGPDAAVEVPERNRQVGGTAS